MAKCNVVEGRGPSKEIASSTSTNGGGGGFWFFPSHNPLHPEPALELIFESSFIFLPLSNPHPLPYSPTPNIHFSRLFLSLRKIIPTFVESIKNDRTSGGYLRSKTETCFLFYFSIPCRAEYLLFIFEEKTEKSKLKKKKKYVKSLLIKVFNTLGTCKENEKQMMKTTSRKLTNRRLFLNVWNFVHFQLESIITSLE